MPPLSRSAGPILVESGTIGGYMRKYALFAAVIALSVFAPTLFAQCSDADKRNLEAFDRAWGDAAQRGDRSALMAIYADDFMDASPAGPTNKTQSIDSSV